MDLQALITALSDGEFHSGSELGLQAGVSRTAVWKALEGLAEYGVAYESCRGKGYRLLERLDMLDGALIKSSIDGALSSRIDLATRFSVGSSNSELSKIYPLFSKPYSLLLVERQTAGRGRRGRVWQSPLAKNIYLSLGFVLDGGAEALQGLSIVVGIAIARTLSEIGVPSVGLKWPNDVWIGERKVAGILVELEGEMTTSWRVTVGVGINVSMTVEESIAIDQPWDNVSNHVNCGRSKLAAKVIESICESLDLFKEKGFAPFVSEYDEYDALSGRQVKLLGVGVEGLARGVDATGALVLERSGGRESFSSGEVSVRLV